MDQYVILGVTLFLCFVISVIFLLPVKRKVTTIPGPDAMDHLEGNFPEIASCGSLYQFLRQLHKHYGNIATFWWGPKLVVSTASAESFQEQSQLYDRPVDLERLFEPLISSESIKFCRGSEAKRRRQVYSKCLSFEQMDVQIDLFNQISQSHADKWCHSLDIERLPLREACLKYSMESFLYGTMGQHGINSTNQCLMWMGHDYVVEEMLNCLRNSVPGMNEMGSQKFAKSVSFIRDHFRGCVAERRRNSVSGRGDHVDCYRGYLLDAVMDLHLPGDSTTSDLVTFFVEGFHSSAMFLMWTLYYLAKHQDAQEKLREELLEVISPDCEREMDKTHLTKLKYLDQVVCESLRCSCLYPLTSRVSHTDTKILGHVIPAGTPVIQCLGSVYQDPSIFPEPEKFDPERFNSSNVSSRDPSMFNPFGVSGGRSCPGRDFAMLQVKVFISVILRKYRLSLTSDTMVTPVYGHVTTPNEDIFLRIEDLCQSSVKHD